MKYEDLTRMYWDLNFMHTKLCENPNIIEFEDDFEECIKRIEWGISNIDEELRNIESYTAQCD